MIAQVLRGGSFNNNADNARSGARNNNDPDNRNDNVGFSSGETPLRSISLLCNFVVVCCVRPTSTTSPPGAAECAAGNAGRSRFAGRGRRCIDGAGESRPWSNCNLHPLDLFVKRELGCRAYLRYVGDFALFSDSRCELWEWKAAIVERLAALRLTIHEARTQVTPVTDGIPWLGFVVYPDRRLVKARKVRYATRHLRQRYADYCDGAISFADFDASVQGWINHVRYADTWGLRERMLEPFLLKPGDTPKAARPLSGRR